jgi:hypothetical protein
MSGPYAEAAAPTPAPAPKPAKDKSKKSKKSKKSGKPEKGLLAFFSLPISSEIFLLDFRILGILVAVLPKMIIIIIMLSFLFGLQL